MSRAYNIGYEATACDNGQVRINTLPIIGRAEMDDLLRDQLGQDGWTKEADGSFTKQVEGESVKISPDLTEAEIIVSAKEAGTAVSDTDYNQERHNRIVAKTRSAHEARLQERVTKKIMKVEEALKPEIDETIRKVYVEALKRKAASMGNVESVQEGTDAQGRKEVTIRVAI